MPSGDTGIRVEALPVAALIAATTAGAEEMLGNSAKPFTPKGGGHR